jgi:cytochrome c6
MGKAIVVVLESGGMTLFSSDLDTSRKAYMHHKWLIVSMVGTCLLLAVSSVASGAEDGAALYKKKCAHCHGASGEGKSKTPALKGTSLDATAITEQITKGKTDAKAPHNKGIAGVSDAQAKAVAEFIKTLK